MPRHPADTIDLIELFNTVQRKTSLSGKPTTFVRLAAPTNQVDRRVKVIFDIDMAPENHWANIEYLQPHGKVKFVLANREDDLFAKKTIEDHGLTQRVGEVLLIPRLRRTRSERTHLLDTAKPASRKTECPDTQIYLVS